MEGGPEDVELVDAAAPDRGVAAPPLAPGQIVGDIFEGSSKPCDGCGRLIVAGQHYLRVFVMFDTAGMELVRLIQLPDGPSWTGIFDTPLCAGLALVLAAERDPFFTDVFRR